MRSIERRKTEHVLSRRKLKLYGKVIRGDGVGRTLGYPTANLTRHYFRHYPVPRGVYAGWATVNDRKHPAMGIVGVDDKVEVHLLDWQGNLYGKPLRMELVQYLRSIRVFRSATALRRQIVRDIARARMVLGCRSRRQPQR